MKMAHCLASLAAAGFVSTADAEPQLAWQLGGFANPEAVLLSKDAEFLYVSNLSGAPAEKNGQGYISLVSTDGEMIEEKWAVGLDAPKGLALSGNRLYVSDIDRLVAIDIADGSIAGQWHGEGAAFLNGLTVDDQGRIYVADTIKSAIYRLSGDSFELWAEGEALGYPNGLRFDGPRILIAAWGKPKEDFTTDVPGHLKAVSIETREVTSVSKGTPIGNLDGIKPDGKNGGWLTTDFMAGALIRINPDGSTEQLLDLDQGSADLEFIESDRVAVIPMMLDDKLVAYSVD
jgi:sugar lactone lactonase YvrE